MLHAWLYPLHDQFQVFNLFKYITFRAFGAMFTAWLLVLVFGPSYISWLKSKAVNQSIRDDGPQTHLAKKGTPTMGGGLILVAIAVATLLWADLSNRLMWVTLMVTLLTGVVGFVDDAKKVIYKNPKGLSSRQKLFWQTVIAGVASVLLYEFQETAPVLKFPFFKDITLDLGYGYIFWASLVIVGASNAVNITDGLDGLVVGPTTTTAFTFAVLAYCAGHLVISEYLQIPHIVGAGELTVFLAAMGAACLGFLWFNAYPAEVFMGDVGALALGAGLGTVAVITKNEFLLVLCGGVFVLETVSVMLQVGSFKLRGKRIFKMAPIHHHFELKGWPETKVIVRFWIISIFLAILTLSTLKLR